MVASAPPDRARLVLEGPGGAHEPAEEDAAGRLEGQHDAPVGSAAVAGALVPAPADEGLEDGDLAAWIGDVVGGDGPPALQPDEEVERLPRRHFDDDGLRDLDLRWHRFLPFRFDLPFERLERVGQYQSR